jgi:mannosyltransferase
LSTGHSVAAAMLLSAILNLVTLARQPLSWDESVSLNAAQRSPHALWTLLRHTDGPLGAYYYGLHLWLRLGATLGIRPSEGWVRLPSALAVIASVGLVTALACRLLGTLAGLAAGAVLTFQPLVAFYATDARPYALAMLLAVGATTVLLADLRRPRVWTVTAYVLLAIAALYDQFWSIYVLAAHGLLIMLRARRWRYAVAAVIVVAAALPLVLLSDRESGELWWIPSPSVATIAGFVTRICGGIGGIAVMVVLGATLWFMRGRTKKTGWRDEDGRLAVRFWLLVPPIGLIVFSFWQPMMVPRYALVFVPAWAIMMVALCLRLPRRAAISLVALIVAVSLVGTVIQAAQPYKYEDFRAIATDVRDTAHAGDGIVYIPTSYRVGMRPYLTGGPTDVLLADPASVNDGPSIGGREVPIGDVTGRIDACPRIYLIGPVLGGRQPGLPSMDVAKESVLRSRFRVIWRRTYGAVSVTLLARA